MTGHNGKAREALNRLADALVDDIFSVSDEDILAEFQEAHGDPDSNAAELRDLTERGIVVANKRRLLAAKAGVAASRQFVRSTSAVPVDIHAARARLRAIANTPGIPSRVTLAARKENELSDIDILGILEDLRELGVVFPDDDKGEPT